MSISPMDLAAAMTADEREAFAANVIKARNAGLIPADQLEAFGAALLYIAIRKA